MKKKAKEKASDKRVMAYININKRITELANMGLLEEIKPNVHTVNIHGRKDYKVTLKGLGRLMLQPILSPAEDVEVITTYMDRVGLDKRVFVNRLIDEIDSNLDFTNQYLQTIGQVGFIPTVDMDKMRHTRQSMIEYSQKLLDVQRAYEEHQSRQVIKSKSRTGHNIKTTIITKRDGYNEYDEYHHKRLLKNEPEIADSELQEDLYRIEQEAKSKPTGVKPIPSAASRKKTSGPQKKKH